MIIKGNTRANIPVVDATSGSEYIKLYVPTISKYFRLAVHHMTERAAYYPKDLLLCFSVFPQKVNCGECRCEEKKIRLKTPTSEELYKKSSNFFDYKSSNRPSCGRLTHIYLQETYFGYICPKFNIFSACDFAHSSNCKEEVAEIFQQLEDKNVISKIESVKTTVTLGTDPEFESIWKGKIIDARKLPDILSKKKGSYESIIYISRDGSGMQREMRPDPSTEPKILTNNIASLIKTCLFFNEELSIVGDTFSIGGHIHLGGVQYSPSIITLLDYFLDPLNILNGKIRNSQDRYGKKGDYRPQPHGIEYRTPPTAWLGTPKLCNMTLTLVKLVAEKHLNGIDIEISSAISSDIYVSNIKKLGLTEKWAVSFLKEISYVKDNIHTPLHLLWKIDIPMKYRMGAFEYETT